MSKIVTSLELVLNVYHSLSLPSMGDYFQTCYFLRAESTLKFFLLSSSIIWQIKLLLEFFSCVLSLTIVATA